MLYWKYSPNRIFLISEYWIITPPILILNYILIRRINLYKRKRILELEKQLLHQQKIQKIAQLALGLGSLYYLRYRGGDEFIDLIMLDKLNCEIEENLQYLDNVRLRNIIFDLFKKKSRKTIKGKLIFITATSVCHLAKTYGLRFLAFPFAVGDFGTTNALETLKTVASVVVLCGIGPVYTLLGPTFQSLLIILGLSTGSLKLAFWNLDKIPTSLIDGSIPAHDLMPRIPNIPDVVIVNFRNRMQLPNPKPLPVEPECMLPFQWFTNSKCKLKPEDIVQSVNQISHKLNYDNVVNLQDVTGIDTVNFEDILDLGIPSPGLSLNSRKKAKMVSFLDKFGDPERIEEMDTWTPVHIVKNFRRRVRFREIE